MNEDRLSEPPRSNFENDKTKLRHEAISAQEKLSQGKDEISHAATSAAQSVKESAYKGAEAGKEYAADSLTDFTAAIRKASDELGDRDQSLGSSLAREAASGLEQLSGALKGKTVQDITRSVAGFARQQPAAFLVGAALAGVALGRFAKASSDHSSSVETTPKSGADKIRPDFPNRAAQMDEPVSENIADATSVLGEPSREFSSQKPGTTEFSVLLRDGEPK